MDADNEFDHLHARHEREPALHDLAPDTSPPPANEAVVAGGVGPKLRQIRQGAPDRKTQKMPLRTGVIHPCNATRLVGSIGLMAPSWSVSS